MPICIPEPKIHAFAPQVYACQRANGKLLGASDAAPLNGDLNKPFWADAPWTAEFAEIEGGDKPVPRFRTRAKLLWNDEALYIGAELEGDEIWAHVTERDDVIFQDNDFEVFIDPDGDTHAYAEFEMNARNTVWDLLLTKPYRDGGLPINSFDIKGLRTAVKIDGALNHPEGANRCWSCEIVMPWQSLAECLGQGSGAPAVGSFWRMNFSRVQWKVDAVDGQWVKRADPATGKPLPEDNWVWSPQGIVNMHYPELWGYVFFCDGPTEVVMPADERLKWELRKLYYAEHRHFDETGRFTAALPRPEGFAVQATDRGFELSCPTADGGSRLVLSADGRIIRQPKE